MLFGRFSSGYRLLMPQGTGHQGLDHAALMQRPTLGNDALRQVSQLPGSASTGLSARPRVRGGNEDETLITFDGVRFYEPFHFRNFNSLFSAFDQRIVDSLDFYSGGYPAEFGDRLSAAMVINPQPPEELREVREIGVGLLNLSYLQAGGDADQDWLLDVRRSSIDLLVGLSENDVGSPAFADMYGRYGWNFNDEDRLSINVLLFGDEMNINNTARTETSQSIYANSYVWLKSENRLGSNLAATSLLGVSAIKNDRKGSVNKPGLVTGELDDSREFRVYHMNQDMTFSPEEQWLLTFGWGCRYLQAEYRYRASQNIAVEFVGVSNLNRPAQANVSVDETGHQLALYSSFKGSFAKRITTEVGVRYDAQHYEHTTHEYQISPRLNMRYQLAPTTDVRFGWGLFSQAEGIHELKIGDGRVDFQVPQEASHLVASLNHQFAGGAIMRIEAYEKRGITTASYYQNLTNPLSLLAELQVDRFEVTPDDYEAEGVELTLSSNWRAMDIWANYSYSSVADMIDGVKVRRSWDQGQAVNLGMSSQYRQWQWSVSGTCNKGWLTTPLQFNNGLVVASPRNSVQFGRYISWDIKASRSWGFGAYQLRLEAGLTNLANRDNPVGVDYALVDGQLQSTTKSGVPLAPFLDVYWRL
jgi:outer membrane cobalamin receptor